MPVTAACRRFHTFEYRQRTRCSPNTSISGAASFASLGLSASGGGRSDEIDPCGSSGPTSTARLTSLSSCSRWLVARAGARRVEEPADLDVADLDADVGSKPGPARDARGLRASAPLREKGSADGSADGASASSGACR